jgi:hypothetical protein
MRFPSSLVRALKAVSFWAIAASVAVGGAMLFGLGFEELVREVKRTGDDAGLGVAGVAVAAAGLIGASVVVSGLWFLGGTVDRLGVRRLRRRLAIGVGGLAEAAGPLIVGIYAALPDDEGNEAPPETPFLTTSALHDSMAAELPSPYARFYASRTSDQVYVRQQADAAIRRYETLRRRAADGTRLTVPALADTLHRLGLAPRPYRAAPLAPHSPPKASSGPQIGFDAAFDGRPRLKAYLSGLARDLRQASWIELLGRVRPRDAIVLLELDQGDAWPLADAGDETTARDAARRILHSAVDRTWTLDEGRASALRREAIREIRFDRLRAPSDAASSGASPSDASPSDATVRVRVRLEGDGLLPGRSSATLHVSLLQPSLRIVPPSLLP